MRLTTALCIFLATGVIALGTGWSMLHRENETVQKPIIAHLYAEPDRFAGRTIEIYGLVIESNLKGEFLLQDISQRPLRVLGIASMGDQVTVVGKLHLDATTIYLTADKLVPTKVTGGGGCC